MELIEIAQLVTGLATLIVASVLIWQMIIQKKALDIAHNDADANMSLQAMEIRSKTNEWFEDNLTPEMIEKFDKGFDSLTPKERHIFQTYFRNILRTLSTEWRLGRLIDEDQIYYKGTFNMGLHFKDKLFREFFKEYWMNSDQAEANSSKTMRYADLMKLGVEIYNKESSGEKLD